MKVKCPKCKYKWETESKLLYVTCPNCQKKFLKNLKEGEVAIWDEAKENKSL
jgi:DNA-directed RNA polymerase subunit RPC12/RpoP